MKKYWLLLIVLLLTGCTIRPFPENIDQKIKNTLIYSHRPNYVTQGYKLYLPIDTTVHNDKNNNLIIYYQGKYLYMYTDLISYYYKYQEGYIYDVNDKVYFSKKLDYQDKLGYIEVRKKDREYFVQVMYNYAKIETIVPKDMLDDTIVTSLTILRSTIYKQKIIELLLNNQNNRIVEEEVYQLFKPKKSKNDFLEYAENYDKFEGEIKTEEPVYDTDQIQLDEEQQAQEQQR